MYVCMCVCGEGGLAFMFETCCTLKVSAKALQSPRLDTHYAACWEGLPKACLPPADEAGDAMRTFSHLGL